MPNYTIIVTSWRKFPTFGDRGRGLTEEDLSALWRSVVSATLWEDDRGWLRPILLSITEMLLKWTICLYTVPLSAMLHWSRMFLSCGSETSSGKTPLQRSQDSKQIYNYWPMSNLTLLKETESLLLGKCAKISNPITYCHEINNSLVLLVRLRIISLHFGFRGCDRYVLITTFSLRMNTSFK